MQATSQHELQSKQLQIFKQINRYSLVDTKVPTKATNQ